MKKFVKAFCFMMAACLSLSFLAACSSDSASGPTSSFESPEALLTTVWDDMDESEKPSVMGGYGEDINFDGPAAMPITDVEGLSATFAVPADLIEHSDAAASAVNAMMANNFTTSAWQLKSGADATELSEKTVDYMENMHWLCGMPESYSIVQVGNMLVVTFGLDSTVNAFTEAIQGVDSGAVVMAEGAIE